MAKSDPKSKITWAWDHVRSGAGRNFIWFHSRNSETCFDCFLPPLPACRVTSLDIPKILLWSVTWSLGITGRGFLEGQVDSIDGVHLHGCSKQP